MAVVHVHVEVNVQRVGLHLSAQFCLESHLVVVDAEIATHDTVLQRQLSVGVAHVNIAVGGFREVEVHIGSCSLVEEVEPLAFGLHPSVQHQRFVEWHKLIDMEVLGINVGIIRIVVHAIVHLRIHVALLGLCHDVGNELVVLHRHVATQLHVLWNVEGTARFLWHKTLCETGIPHLRVEVSIHLHLLLVGRVGNAHAAVHRHGVWHVGIQILHMDFLQVSTHACHEAHLLFRPCLAESFQIRLCKQTDVALAEMSTELCLKLSWFTPLALCR